MGRRPASKRLRKWVAAGAMIGLLVGAGAIALNLGGGDGEMAAGYITYLLGWPISLVLWDSALSLPWPARDARILTLNGALWAGLLAVLIQAIADLQHSEKGPPGV